MPPLLASERRGGRGKEDKEQVELIKVTFFTKAGASFSFPSEPGRPKGREGGVKSRRKKALKLLKSWQIARRKGFGASLLLLPGLLASLPQGLKELFLKKSFPEQSHELLLGSVHMRAGRMQPSCIHIQCKTNLTRSRKTLMPSFLRSRPTLFSPDG